MESCGLEVDGLEFFGADFHSGGVGAAVERSFHLETGRSGCGFASCGGGPVAGELRPDGVPAPVVAPARQGFAKTEAPRKSLAKTDTSASSRYIPAAVRRVVHERDGGRCTFVNLQGRRCKARERLEFHHHDRPYRTWWRPPTGRHPLDVSRAQWPHGRARVQQGVDGSIPKRAGRRRREAGGR